MATARDRRLGAAFGVTLRTTPGTPVTAGGTTVTPLAQALVVRTPLGHLVWNRPVALRIERAGRVERRRIVDATRVAQAGLLAATGIALTALILSGRKDGNP